MARDESKPLPHFGSLDELVKSFDNQDWGDYLAQMSAVDFAVDLKRRMHFIALETDLAGQVEEIARARRTSSEALVNTWIREKILQQQ